MSYRNKCISRNQTPSLVQTTNKNPTSITSPLDFQKATHHEALSGSDQTTTSVLPLSSTLVTIPPQDTDQDYEPMNDGHTNDYYTDMTARPNAYTNLAYNIHNNISPNAIPLYVNVSYSNTEYEYIDTSKIEFNVN